MPVGGAGACVGRNTNKQKTVSCNDTKKETKKINTDCFFEEQLRRVGKSGGGERREGSGRMRHGHSVRGPPHEPHAAVLWAICFLLFRALEAVPSFSKKSRPVAFM